MNPPCRQQAPPNAIPTSEFSMDDYEPYPEVAEFKSNVERLSKVSTETLQSRFDV